MVVLRKGKRKTDSNLNFFQAVKLVIRFYEESMQCMLSLWNYFYTKEDTESRPQLAIDKRKVEQVIEVARLIIFFIIVHDFSNPAKQVINDTYYFYFTLLLVIPQIKTYAVCAFNLKLHIVPSVTNIVCKKKEFLKVSQKFRTFWASAWS